MMLCPVDYYYYDYYPSPWYELITSGAVIGVAMILLVPPAIGYMLWRIFVTNRLNPQGGVCVLGLSETTATHAEMYGRRISGWTFALRVLTSLLTFKLGLLAFHFYYYVIETLLE